MTRPPQAGEQRLRVRCRQRWRLLTLLAWLPVVGCQSLPPLDPIDLNAPGWVVREGQALWRRNREAPELAGELLIATHGNESAFVQFSKAPFPLVIARRTDKRW